MNKRILAAAFAASGFFAPCSAAFADEQKESPAVKPAVWLTSGFLSRHDSNGGAPERGWNETNGGIGVEYAFHRNWRLAAGVYDNSLYRTSRYAQFVWSPDRTTLHIGACKLMLGAAVGTVDGYPRMRKGGFFLTLLPVASIEWRRLGMNLTYIPSIAGNVAGALALQAKFRFF